MVTLVTVDVRERRSNVPALLEELGATVEMRRLDAGDYVCGPQTVVERKTVRDLHLTIIGGRLWRQLGALRDSARWPCLMVEGRDLFRGRIDADAIRGTCLAATDLGIVVLRTDDALDTAQWLYRLAVRRQETRVRDRPVYAQRPRRSRKEPLAEAALSTVPGISVVVARSLLARFGSLANLAAADPESWANVWGVGPERAAGLRSLMHDEWPPQLAISSPRGDEMAEPTARDPST